MTWLDRDIEDNGFICTINLMNRYINSAINNDKNKYGKPN